MKIIRRSLLVLGITLASAAPINLFAESLTQNEQEARTLVTKLVDGDPAVSREKLPTVCTKLVALLQDSNQWPELRALLAEYAQLDITKLTFVTKTKKLKEICDRLVDLKNRNKLPADLLDAVNRVRVLALIDRLKTMLTV